MTEEKELAILSIVDTLETLCKQYEANFTQNDGDYGNASVKIDENDANQIKLHFGWSGYEESANNDIKIYIISNGKSIINHTQDGHYVTGTNESPTGSVHKFNTYDELTTFIKAEMGV